MNSVAGADFLLLGMGHALGSGLWDKLVMKKGLWDSGARLSFSGNIYPVMGSGTWRRALKSKSSFQKPPFPLKTTGQVNFSSLVGQRFCFVSSKLDNELLFKNTFFFFLIYFLGKPIYLPWHVTPRIWIAVSTTKSLPVCVSKSCLQWWKAEIIPAVLISLLGQ